MLSEGKTFKQISAVIREKGYDGADGTIRMFATRERRLMKEAAAQGGSGEKIERKWLISLCTTLLMRLVPSARNNWTGS